MTSNPPETRDHPGYRLERDPFGRLALVRNGQRIAPVVPVRSFPIAAPDEGIALIDPQGREAAWIERLEDLPADLRALIADALASREFVPKIQRIRRVSTYATPSIWQVDTDRGPTQLTLRAEEDIRRLSAERLLIADSHGTQFLIRDVSALDKTSRRFLDHFL
ncbi:DUF1854 domain-containing protein [Castellaniella sp. GW247-6E4]|uniref:cyanophycin metabolism-associated DUF1854 family protein n=1 Tax=Castellaniella sp. GW247-6E4 TaxID=3140380 RepID=UPI0033149E6C